MQAVATRMARELKLLQNEPPPGVWAGPKGDSMTELEAQIQGPADTVYEGGVFKLEVNIPARYPFEPPKVRFVTPIYHPNIDGEGRICLDILNMPPKGAWKPSLNISTVLVSIGLLLAEPNPDDGLVADITQEFRHQRQVFDAKARQSTRRYAMQQQEQPGAGVGPQSEEPQQEQQQQQQQGDGQAAGQAAGSNAGTTEPAVQQQQQEQQQQEAEAGLDAGAATGQQAAKQGERNENSGTAANLPAQDPEAPQCAGGEAAAAPAKRPRLTLRR